MTRPEDEVCTRAGKFKSLIRWKRREKAEKGEFDLQLDFWQKKYLNSRDVLNPDSEGSAESHSNRFQTKQCNSQIKATKGALRVCL